MNEWTQVGNNAKRGHCRKPQVPAKQPLGVRQALGRAANVGDLPWSANYRSKPRGARNKRGNNRRKDKNGA